MQIRVFSVTAVDAAEDECQELNAFLRGHRILNVSKEYVLQGGIGYWTFCVEYLEGGGDIGGKGMERRSAERRVDYKEILEADVFARFLMLRECRKIIAEENGVPPYALWKDEVQAELAKLPVLNKKSMMSVKGLGKGTFDRYGDRFLSLWKEKTNEACGESILADNGDGESPSGVLEGAKGEAGKA